MKKNDYVKWLKGKANWYFTLDWINPTTGSFINFIHRFVSLYPSESPKYLVELSKGYKEFPNIHSKGLELEIKRFFDRC